MQDYRSALIVGAGDGLSASLARLFAAEGLKVGLAARNADKLRELGGRDGCGDRRLRRWRAGPGRSAVRRRWMRRSAGRRTSSSTTPARAVAARWSSSTRRRWPTPCASRRLAGSWSRKQAARRMLPRARVPSCSPAPQPASRATSTPRRSRWASSRCAAWPRALPASLRRKASMSPTSSLMAPSAIPVGPRRRTRRIPCSTPMRSRAPISTSSAAPQRLDLGGRAAPVGRELLAPAVRRATTAPAATAIRTLGSGLARSLAGLLKGASSPSRASRADCARVSLPRGPSRSPRQPPDRPARIGCATIAAAAAGDSASARAM